MAVSLAAAAGAGAGVGAACSEAVDGTVAALNEFELGSEARLRMPLFVSPVGFGASLVPSPGGEAIRSAVLGIGLGGVEAGGAASSGTRVGALVEATCSMSGTFGRAT